MQFILRILISNLKGKKCVCASFDFADISDCATFDDESSVRRTSCNERKLKRKKHYAFKCFEKDENYQQVLCDVERTVHGTGTSLHTKNLHETPNGKKNCNNSRPEQNKSTIVRCSLVYVSIFARRWGNKRYIQRFCFIRGKRESG